MVYLDNYNKQRSDRLHGKIVKAGRRPHVIHGIIDLLEDYRLSPWEHEGDIRSNVRSALCLLGHEWMPADSEAADLLEAAFKKMGVKRPSRSEGQRNYSTSPDNCKRCGIPLSIVQQIGTHNFCGVRCAQLALFDLDYKKNYFDRGFEYKWWDDEVGRSAYRLILKSKTKPRKCAICSEEFQVLSEARENRFCSKACRNDSMRTRELRPCEACQTPFLPNDKKARFCSRECLATTGKEYKHINMCKVCGAAFAAANPYAIYCSQRCNAKAYHWRKKGKVKAPPRVGDRMCECGRMHSSVSMRCSRCSSPTPIRRPLPMMTPRRFDRLFKMAA